MVVVWAAALLLLPQGQLPAQADVISVKKKLKKKRLKPTPPRRAWSRDRLCKGHRDCVLMPPYPCDCPPCGDVWREAVNRRTYRAWKKSWARKLCKRPRCKMCKGRYLGTKALCLKKQCTVR